MKKPLLILAALFLMYSCASEKEAKIISQEANIDSYISRQFKDSLVIRNSGSNRIVLFRDVAADSLAFGDSLYLYYAGYVFTSGPSTIFATNVESLADKFKITNPDFSPKKILFTQDSMIPGLVNGLIGAREGEHSIIIFSAKYGFYDDKVYNIPQLSALLYEVFVDRVVKK